MILLGFPRVTLLRSIFRFSFGVRKFTFTCLRPLALSDSSTTVLLGKVLEKSHDDLSPLATGYTLALHDYSDSYLYPTVDSKDK